MAKAKTIALVGSTSDEFIRISDLLELHQQELNERWQLGGEVDAGTADLVLADTDSVYGHMGWLKAQSRGRPLATYTDTPTPNAPNRVLRKPAEGYALVELLNAVSLAPSGSALSAPTEETFILKETLKKPLSDITENDFRRIPPEPARGLTPDFAVPSIMHLDQVLIENVAFDTPVKLVSTGLPVLVLDSRTQTYHAPPSLKALTVWCSRELTREEFTPISYAELSHIASTQPGQPYTRLLWLARLVRGKGQLSVELSPAARYKLARWPQSEREFPKHFRIATVMMKQLATLTEISKESGATLAEVNDFINAYHGIGFIEIEDTVAVSPERAGGLFAKLRKPFGN